MDAFVKRFFPDFDAPGLSFSEMGPGMVRHAYMQGNLKIFDQQVTRCRNLTFSQPMTMLGRVRADFNTSASSLDGIGKPYLTPEGMFNLQTIGDTLKNIGGMQSQIWSAHMGTVRAWPWADNHVSLIVNALRYILITKSVEASDVPLNDFPEYNDGHVRINRNQWWSGYPDVSTWDLQTWPGGSDPDNYPVATRLTDSHPTHATNAIDLRGLTSVEARFMLLMLGTWGRRSRMRLDFSLPLLTENVYYRSEGEIPGLTGWFDVDEADVVIPPPPNSSIAWAALMKYVAHNRVFDHFSTALHLVTSLMYQVLPVTAEGQVWLSFDWYLSLPSFSSVRGRYTFLNEDEPAFVSHRALGEWSYIGNKLEKIHLMAVLFIQAIQTGMAVRSTRYGLETNPEDLYNTYVDFYSPVNMTSAAAAEAIRGAVPLAGMSGVYVNLAEDFDSYQPDRQIKILNDSEAGLEGYDIVPGVGGGLAIPAPWTVLPGVPTMLLPINPFPYNSIMSLKGVIAPDLGNLERRGFRVKAPQAWLIASVYRMAGYDIDVRYSGNSAGGRDYFAPNDVQMSWPVLFQPDEQGDDIILVKQHERDAHFIDLPIVTNNFFKGNKLEYEIRPVRRGMSLDYQNNREDIFESGGIMSMFSKITLAYTVTGTVQRLRSYITRSEQGFQFVDTVKGGVIPATAVTATASGAAVT
uniref:Capsid protein n=1 Tax=Cynanchum associated totivirus TaxID=3161584 RepID=A0AAU6R540_9VIRU